jgi:uncharacterized protein YPO0396
VKPRWMSATGRLVAVAVCRLVRFFDFELCERYEIMRVQGNVKNAWEELNQTPPDVEAAKRCLQAANTQSKVLMNESDEEGLILGSPSTYPRRRGS